MTFSSVFSQIQIINEKIILFFLLFASPVSLSAARNCVCKGIYFVPIKRGKNYQFTGKIYLFLCKIYHLSVKYIYFATNLFCGKLINIYIC